jgi:hypothetical protein
MSLSHYYLGTVWLCVLITTEAIAQSVSGASAPSPTGPRRSIAAALRIDHASVRSAPGGVSIVDVQLENTSKKAIHAFRLTYTVKYPDGSSTTNSITSDLLNLYARAAVSSPQEQRFITLFRSGETFKEESSVARSKDGSNAVDVYVEVGLVVFDDGTAIGEPTEIRRVASDRKLQAAKYSLIAGDLRSIAQAADRVKAWQALHESLLSGADPGATPAVRVASPGMQKKETSPSTFLRERADYLVREQEILGDGSRLERDIQGYDQLARFALAHSSLVQEVTQ